MQKKRNNNLNVYFCDIPNMGDQLNVHIINKLWNINIVKSNIYNGKISAIGSGLGAFTTRGHRMWGIEQRIVGHFCKPIYVWGTGFIQRRKDDVEGTFFREMRFCAVRGNFSKERVEKILGLETNIPVGDGGILASCLIQSPSNKLYSVGIIPHWREKNHPVFNHLLSLYPNSVLIDVNKNPLQVVKDISCCKVIISSSLHGLIVADSFHIPNIHVVVTDKMIGDGFKFDDYYSAYNLKHRFFCPQKQEMPNVEWIIENYRISYDDIECMKKRMFDSFPFVFDKSKNVVVPKKKCIYI